MTSIIDPEFISETFPTLNEITYLNNAAKGIPPIDAVNAMKKYLDDRIKAMGTFQDSLDLYQSVRDSLAKLLGGERRNYGFVTNTSMGINTIAHSIDYPEGSNIVLCDLEFPANYIPWQNISRLYDVELRILKTKGGAAPFDEFKALIDDNTFLVAVSHVQFGTGYRCDVKELAKAVHEVGGFLLDDTIQSAGYITTDFVKMGVDFAAGNSHKWLVGPIGAGYVYVSDEALEKTTPRFMGWFGVKDFIDFGYSIKEPADDATRFNLGSPAKVAYVGLDASLKVILSLSDKVRENAAIGNGDYLRKRLTEMDIECYDFGPKNNSAIVSCVIPDVEEVIKKLSEDKIFCCVRNGRLRISPHFYNSHEELDLVLDQIS